MKHSKNLAKRIYTFFRFFGIDPLKTYRSLLGLPWYLRDLSAYNGQAKSAAYNDFPIKSHAPFLTDKNTSSGFVGGHYFHQDLLVARRIFKDNPDRHLDIGSRVDGFVAHVASFRKITVADIRSTPTAIPNIDFIQMDFMNAIPDELVNSWASVSSLHALEHFGLGRYGDPVDIHGHLKGLRNLSALLKMGGTLYLSVPIGDQRTEFNAHRVFSVSYLLSLFEEFGFSVEDFSFVDDLGDLHESVSTDTAPDRLHYGCGIFVLRKKALPTQS